MSIDCQYFLLLGRCDSQYQVVNGKLCNGIFDCPQPNGPNYEWGKNPGFAADECRANCSTENNTCTDNTIIRIDPENVIQDIPCARIAVRFKISMKTILRLQQKTS